mgnify:CR=1 FL=1|jgi:Transketolase, C-terminal subunit
MRKVLAESLLQFSNKPEFVFMTGDLGFMTLESLQMALGPRFINAGVAEQNMVSVSAGLAKAGMKPWIYSIAPFIYARPFEQIRNDVCAHGLPVVLIGNGGGYAYGVMGSTHHAIEDYGALLCLPNMRIFIPAFNEDVTSIVNRLYDIQHPAYLRLGKCEKPQNFELPRYSPWRRLITGNGPTMIVIGPLVGGLIEPLSALDEYKRPNLWVVTELPLDVDTMPDSLLENLKKSNHLIVAEEHVQHGGLGEMLGYLLLTKQLFHGKTTHLSALGYISGLYGSQNFHRRESSLDPQSITTLLEES